MTTFTIATAPDDYGSGTTNRIVRTDMTAPLPLGWALGMRRACQLRMKGSSWSWPVIASVMGEYHGLWYSASYWADHVTGELGDIAKRPRGNAYRVGVGRPGVAA